MKNICWLIIILAMSLTFRFLIVLDAQKNPERLETPDSVEYISLGQNLVRTGEFERKNMPEIFRVPAYPAFIAATDSQTWKIYSDPAKRRNFELSAWLAPIYQSVLDVILVLIVFWMGAKFYSKKVGLVAAAFQGFTMIAVASSCRVLSDSLYAFCFTASLFMFLQYLRKGGAGWLILSALVSAGACYIRSAGLVAGAIFVLVLLVCKAGYLRSEKKSATESADEDRADEPTLKPLSNSIFRRFARAIIFAIIFAGVLAPWVYRNATVADYAGFSSVADQSGFNYQAPYILAQTKNISLDQARAEMIQKYSASVSPGGKFYDPGKPFTTGHSAKIMRALNWEIVKQHPQLYAKIHLKGSLRTWLPGASDVLEITGKTTGQRGTLDVIQREGFIAGAKHYLDSADREVFCFMIAMCIAWALKMICAFYGSCRLFLKNRFRLSSTAICLILIVIVFAILPGPAAHPRFRVPIAPILSLAAGLCLFEVKKSSKEKSAN